MKFKLKLLRGGDTFSSGTLYSGKGLRPLAENEDQESRSRGHITFELALESCASTLKWALET